MGELQISLLKQAEELTLLWAAVSHSCKKPEGFLSFLGSQFVVAAEIHGFRRDSDLILLASVLRNTYLREAEKRERYVKVCADAYRLFSSRLFGGYGG